MSPPSLATAGRTRVSIRSLICATVSASFSSKNSSSPAVSVDVPALTIGAPDMKCSMMAPSSTGLSCCQSPSVLVTEMKSVPKKTPPMPSTSNSRVASGDCPACALSRMSRVPSASTVRPGRNLSVAGLGVVSVWMNMGGSPSRRGFKARAEYALLGSFRPRGQPPRGRHQVTSGPHEADDVLDVAHGFARDHPCASRPVGEYCVDMRGILHQALHLGADRAEPRNRKIDQRRLEARELRSAEFAQHVGLGPVGERREDADEIVGLRTALQALLLVRQR